MSRRSFLLGHLSGLILGALLMWGGYSLREPRIPLPQQMTIQAVSAPPVEFSPLPPGSQIDRWTHEAPPSTRDIPPDWQRHDFNGRPVYIIPLANRRN
jgi:hypothetical protein